MSYANTSTTNATAATEGWYELHCHLDASLRLSTIADLARENGVQLECPVEKSAVAPADVGSLQDFLSYIDIAVDVLQTPDALRRAARELVEDWQADGVAYGELRFAPQLHTRRGLTLDEVIDAVSNGAREGSRATGVDVSVLLCCLRHQDIDTSLAVVDAAIRHRAVVAGLDLAGDETYPGATHREAFDLAARSGLPITVHAGEAAGPESIWEALDVLGAQRIGHGVRSVTDRALMTRLRADRIALEMCPTCNVRTRAVPVLNLHPAHLLLRQGLIVTINTDARCTADTTLTDEFAALTTTFGWTELETRRVQNYAREAAFRTATPSSQPRSKT